MTTALYHKIPTLFRRDPKTHRVIIGEYTDPTIQALAPIDWIFTEKVDGTNIRIIWDGHRVTFGGRTDNAQIPPHLLAELERLIGDTAGEQLLEEAFGDKQVILFGEGYGPKIQKGGGNYRDTAGFALFDVTVDGKYLTRDSVEGVGQRLGLDVVPVIFTGPLDRAVDVVSTGFKSMWGDFWAEGLIGTPSVPLFTWRGDRVIVKVKHADLYGAEENAA